MRLSVVIPAYNEADRLPRTLTDALAWLDAHLADDFEVIVVDDGSTDATASRVQAVSHPALRLLRQPENRGKGAAVRRGMLEASGDVRLFMDADHSTHIREVTRAFAALDAGADIAIASRQHPDSEIPVRQSWLRERMGKGFNLLMRMTVGIDLPDTQCGFKAFTAEAAERIFPLLRIEGFGFDVEALHLAMRLGFRVAEFPVRWVNDAQSKVRMLSDPARMFAELVRIRRMHRRIEAEDEA
ncbi:MAG: glycosyltransferase family 2 protein [Mariprofundaceae bacterium]